MITTAMVVKIVLKMAMTTTMAFPDSSDNCQYVANQNQANYDSAYESVVEGDACDLDDDTMEFRTNDDSCMDSRLDFNIGKRL